MKISVNYGIIHQEGTNFRADRGMLIELSSLLPEITISLGAGGATEKAIEVIMIGPCTDLNKPSAVEVVIVLTKEADRKPVGQFVVLPEHLSPLATPEQRRRNVLAPLRSFLRRELELRAMALRQRLESVEFVSQGIKEDPSTS